MPTFYRSGFLRISSSFFCTVISSNVCYFSEWFVLIGVSSRESQLLCCECKFTGTHASVFLVALLRVDFISIYLLVNHGLHPSSGDTRGIQELPLLELSIPSHHSKSFFLNLRNCGSVGTSDAHYGVRGGHQ